MNPLRPITSLFLFILLTVIPVCRMPVTILRTILSISDTEVFPVSWSSRHLHPVFKLPFISAETDPVVIPLKQSGHLFLIEAEIDGQSGNLIFDTGAKELVLNSTYFRKYVQTGKVTSSGITGPVGGEGKITVGRIEFADMVFTNLTADRTDLGHIENRRGVKILGMTGFALLRNFEIIIDPIHGQLILHRIDKTGKRLNNAFPLFESDLTQKIEGSGNIVFLKGSIGGKTLNFCFDTAAETNVISNNSGKNVLSTITITRRARLKGAGSAVSEVLFGKLNNFSMGAYSLSDMDTVVTSLFELNEAYDTHIDGVLGYSFLKHGEICVNFLKSQIGIRFVKGEEP
jgi:hypothetical protein